MIELKDKRKFFTDKKHYPQLVEFSKAFDAEMSIVRTDEEVVDLVSLANVVCDDSVNIKRPSFEILEPLVPRVNRCRSKMRHDAKIIRRWIKRQLLAGRPVKLSDLAQRYKRYNLSLACFCNHFTAVRKQLQEEGYAIQKIKRGEYQLACSSSDSASDIKIVPQV
jgi:hypothetical protein